MCGLSGLWQPGGGREDVLRAAVAAMAGTLVHRGPDAGGDYVDGLASLCTTGVEVFQLRGRRYR